MDKTHTLQLIAELLEQQEDAIFGHPAETAFVYVICRDAFIEGERSAEESEWSRALSLTLDELSLMHHYMVSSSFISAWYHLMGDKAKRDGLTNSCCSLVASLGPDWKQVTQKYIEYEQLWRRTMKQDEIIPHRSRFATCVLVFAIVGLALLLFLAI